MSESLPHGNSTLVFGRSHDRSHSKQLKPDPQPDGEDNDKTLSDCVDSAQEEEVEEEETEYVPVIPAWTRCSPADLYFSRDVKVRLSFVFLLNVFLQQ